MCNIKWLGIPFKDDAAEGSFESCNCWGLVRLYYKEELGITLPVFSIPEIDVNKIAIALDENKSLYAKLNQPEINCIIPIRYVNQHYVDHVALYIGNNRLLHTNCRVGSHILKLNSPLIQRRLSGYYMPIIENLP